VWVWGVADRVLFVGEEHSSHRVRCAVSCPPSSSFKWPSRVLLKGYFCMWLQVASVCTSSHCVSVKIYKTSCFLKSETTVVANWLNMPFITHEQIDGILWIMLRWYLCHRKWPHKKWWLTTDSEYFCKTRNVVFNVDWFPFFTLGNYKKGNCVWLRIICSHKNCEI
jgi:hypothetical protein